MSGRSLRESFDRAPIKFADEPRWVEANALLSDATTKCDKVEQGWIVRNDAAGIAVVIGRPSRTQWQAIVSQTNELAVLFDDPQRELTTIATQAGRAVEEVTFAVLDEPPSSPHQASLLLDEETLEHIEPTLRKQLNKVRQSTAIWTVRVEGMPVSFAYAAWKTARWFDVVVDTSRPFRQLGLATIATSGLLAAEMQPRLPSEPTNARQRRRSAVWGSVVRNTAAQRLAAKLGFESHGSAYMLVPSC
jgi:hypothetical protein